MVASGGDSDKLSHTVLKNATPWSELKFDDAAMNVSGNLDDKPALT